MRDYFVCTCVLCLSSLVLILKNLISLFEPQGPVQLNNIIGSSREAILKLCISALPCPKLSLVKAQC